METLKDYFNTEFIDWLHKKGLEYKLVTLGPDGGDLNILYNDKYCIKLYDRTGHGFGVNVNGAEKYDESIYNGKGEFALGWAYEYFKLKETAEFHRRTEGQYQNNLPNLMTDLRKIITKLSKIETEEWAEMTKWIHREAERYSRGTERTKSPWWKFW